MKAFLSQIRRRWIVVLAAALAALAAACGGPTGIIVEVSSRDLRIPEDVDALRFTIDADGGQRAEETFELDSDWPHSLGIRPGKAGNDAAVTIVVEALKDGDVALRHTIETSFMPGVEQLFRVQLEQACVGVFCPGSLNCNDGRCPLVDGGTDAGTDAGVDAGMDAGRDAGMDAGRDAGMDAGVDAGTDAGIDAGTDAGTDAGPIDAGPFVPCDTSGETCNDADDDGDGRVDEGLPCPGTLVISEVATGGPSSGLDEFVEIHNTTDRAICLDGIDIEYRSSSGSSYSDRASITGSQVIPAYGYYLAVGESYDAAARGAEPDTPPAEHWGTGLAASGGHVRLYVRGTSTELDRLGWGDAVEPEGTAMSALSDDTSGSYERKADGAATVSSMTSGADADCGNGHDTDDNLSDFIQRPAAEPQNTASAPEAPCG